MDTIRFVRDHFNMTILLIEHDMKLVSGICEKLTVLNFGHVLTEGPTSQVLNELCDYGVDESLIRKISKRSGIPYADPDEPDEEIPLKEAQPKKPGLFSSILMGMALAGSHKPKSTGRCTGDCAHCPPHYGCRYGRWYYGHGHTHGCEFCGNGGCSGKCNID